MMSYRMAIIGVLTLLLLAGPATGLEPAGLCDGSGQVTVGQWARYQTDVPLVQQKMELRYAIVGTEVVGGVDHYWLEVDFPTPAGSMIFQLLVPGYPYADDAVRKVIAKMNPALPAMEYPPAMATSFTGKDNFSDALRMACEEAANGVPDSVTVPAGTFSAERIPLQGQAKDIWVSPEVPFGVVKIAEHNGKGLELMEYGNNAESAITETAQKLPGGP